jgi:mono/diheme cytochrome c family protein
LLVLAFAGCGGDDGEEAEQPRAPTRPETAAPQTGEAIFSENCGGCHTLAAAGTSGTVGPNLDEHMKEHMLGISDVEEQVRNGGGGMPAFEGKLTDAQIKSVAEYVFSTAGG